MHRVSNPNIVLLERAVAQLGPLIDEMGFGNEWYEQALRHPVEIQLPSGTPVRVVTSPYFLATKLAAFEGRGNNDYVMSHDIEDIIAVLDGRPEVINEINHADEALREHLSAKFSQLLTDTSFTAALPGHMPGDDASQARLPLVIDRIKGISKCR